MIFPITLPSLPHPDSNEWKKAAMDSQRPSKAKRLKARAQRKKMQKHHKKNR